MTRVAVVHNLKSGGAARRLSGTLSAWAADPDLTLQVFTFSGAAPVGPSNLNDRRHESMWAPEAPGAPAPLRPLTRYADVRGLARAWRQIAEHINNWQPDVTFLNPCRYLVGASPAVQWIEAPSVLYVDEARRFDYEPGGRRSSNRATRGIYAPLYRAYRSLDRGAVLAAQDVLSNSSFSANKIRAAYGREAAVFAPGVDPVFCPAPAEEAVSLTGAPYALSVGSLIPSKGHDLAIEGVAACRSVGRLVVVTPRGDREEQLRLGDIADRSGVDLEIRVGVEDEQLVTLYRNASCTIYLAKLEPLGLASLESQACGTPVVVADEGGLRETVTPGSTGVRVLRAADAVARGIDDVVERRTEMAAACRDRRPLTTETASVRLLAHLRTIEHTEVTSS